MSIFETISSAVDSVSALFSGSESNLYISDGIQYALSVEQPNNWSKDLGYSFEVINTPTGGGVLSGIGGALGEAAGNALAIAGSPGLSGFAGIPFPNAVQVGGPDGGSPGFGAFKPFKLQINPTNIEQSENFGVNVIPTQTGVVSEHQGFIVKDLIISGTTGLTPTKSSGGVTKGVEFGNTSIIPSGVPIFTGGRTGYLEFIQLRNYFRAYAELKKNTSYAGLRMVFHNNKDNEHWFVEPVGPGFSASRDASRPFLYDYQINLKIVGKFTRNSGFGGLFGDILDTISNVENVINNVSNAINFASNVFNGSAQFLETIQRDVAITVLGPIDNAAEAINALKNAKNRISALPKTFYNNLKTSVTRLRDNVFDSFGQGSTTYNKVVGRTGAPVVRSFLFTDVNLYQAFVVCENALNKILANDSFFVTNSNEILPISSSKNVTTSILLNQASNIAKRPDSVQKLVQAFGGGLSFQKSSSVSEAMVEYGETIERFTARVLGNPLRFHEIVLLNNLDAPYFSEKPIAGKKTASSGARLLIPSSAPREKTGTIDKSEAYFTRDLTSIERSLGTDIKLTHSADLSVNKAIPDLELIAGINNAAQAIGIAIGVERGSLLLHPNKGIHAQVGKKNISSAAEIVSDIEDSVLSDPRFLSVANIAVERLSNVIALTLLVKIRNVNRTIPFKLNAPSVQTS